MNKVIGLQVELVNINRIMLDYLITIIRRLLILVIYLDGNIFIWIIVIITQEIMLIDLKVLVPRNMDFYVLAVETHYEVVVLILIGD